MKSLFVILLITVFAASMHGEESWKKEGMSTLNLSYTDFDNWSKGGENALSWLLDVNASAKHQAGKHHYALISRITYGQTRTGGGEARKNSDEFRLDGEYFYALGSLVNPYANLSFITQMTPGYDYTDSSKIRQSDIMEPAYFTQSFGAGYIPREWLSLQAGMALKETFSDEFAVSYSDDPETAELEKVKIEPGGEVKANLNYAFSETMKIRSKAEFFMNFKGLDEIDVLWDSQFSASFNKLLSLNLSLRMLYDKDLSHKRQIRQMAAVGFTYQLFNAE